MFIIAIAVGDPAIASTFTIIFICTQTKHISERDPGIANPAVSPIIRMNGQAAWFGWPEDAARRPSGLPLRAVSCVFATSACPAVPTLHAAESASTDAFRRFLGRRGFSSERRKLELKAAVKAKTAMTGRCRVEGAPFSGFNKKGSDRTILFSDCFC